MTKWFPTSFPTGQMGHTNTQQSQASTRHSQTDTGGENPGQAKKDGAEDGVRTRGLLLGKEMLYH